MQNATRQETSRDLHLPLALSPTLLAALVLALSVAALDLISIVVFSQNWPLASPVTALSHLAGSLIAFLAIYALFWVALVVPLKFIWKLPSLPLSLGLGVCLSFPWFLRALGAPVTPPELLENPYRAVMVAGFSVAAGAAVYLLTRIAASSNQPTRLLVIAGLAAPVLLLEVLLVFWFRFFYISGPLSLKSLLYAAGAFGVMCLTLFLLTRWNVSRRVPGFLLAVIGVLLLVPAASLALSGLVSERSTPVVSRQHPVKRVILISVDTLRRDVLAPYTPSSRLSPHIEALARDSVVFENAYSTAPWTGPSIASIMTGLTPWVHGVGKNKPAFPELSPALAEYFFDAGYVTAAFGANGMLAKQRRLQGGFQTYRFVENSPPETLGVLVLDAILGERWRRSWFATDQITESARSWIRANHDQDFFLWVHYFDPHTPYAPPEEFLPRQKPPAGMGTAFTLEGDQLRSGTVTFSPQQGAWIKKLYDAEVRYVDDRIGRIIALLKELDLYDEALIVFTSDHGEEFWDHGGLYHGHNLYNELLAVPLLIKLPGSSAPGKQTIKAGVSTVSLMPTILELCEIGYQADQFSGSSLTPLWKTGGEPEGERALFSTSLVYYEDRESVVHQGWKYIRFIHRPIEEAYDLARDPKESANIVKESPERVEELRRMLDEHRRSSQELQALYGIGQVLDEAEQERLRRELKSLGYIQ